MTEGFAYAGKELELFSKATNWKAYMTSFINPHIKGRVLEVGAGLGAMSDWMNCNQFKEWVLLEPDPNMAALLRHKILHDKKYSNCSVISGTTASAGLEKYDTIVYIDVLEHIADDKGEINRAIGLLNENGTLIVLCPAFQCLFNAFDSSVGHFRRYNKRTLQQVCGEILKKESLRYLDTMGFFSSLVNKLVLRQENPTAKQIAFWDGFLVRISAVVDRFFLYSFGKSILGIWKKNQ